MKRFLFALLALGGSLSAQDYMPTIRLLNVGNTSQGGSTGTVAIRNVTTGPIEDRGRWLDINFPVSAGPQGATGATGAAGSAATITLGSVTSGATPSITNTGSASAAVFNFVLQKGDTGAQGPAGTNGTNGSNASVTGSAPIIVTSGVVSISPASGSAAGSMSTSDFSKLAAYPSYQARSFSTPTYASATTATQLSATRDANVHYEFDASTAITVLGTQTVNAFIYYADNAGMTTNPVLLDSQTVTMGGVLGLSSTTTLRVGGWIPAGKYRRVTFSVGATGIGLGNPTSPATLKSGQEVLH